MSLGPTYVKADDGLLYRDPVIEGPGWFICFDEDEPPELVMTDRRRELRAEDAQAKLDGLGIDGVLINDRANRSGRTIGKKSKPAAAWFFQLMTAFPARLIPSGCKGRRYDELSGSYTIQLPTSDAERGPQLPGLEGRVGRE